MATTKKPAIAARVAALGQLATSKLYGAPPPAAPGSKIGMLPGPIDRNQAQAPSVGATAAGASQRMSATTYITQVPKPSSPTPVLYSADRLWARVTVILETAGPVAIGFSSNLSPVTNGNGILLKTDIPIVLDISKGNKLYIQATGINRVKLIVQTVPWLEQITGILTAAARFLGVPL